MYSTGNIVQPTVAGTNQTPWVNGVYQDQLTCWAWGNPGNCGPNPSVRPGGYINYSFGYTDLYQAQSIAGLLPTTGLRVNGYNFGFTAKNGNGWDDGRVDQLSAYVNFYGTNGSLKDQTVYDLNSKFNWTQFNYSKDFVSPYAAADLSTVRYGFVGKDNNFWAGNYGPEIMDVSFSLKYSVDPCATNPLYSPSCKGYMDALAKLAPAPVTVVADAPPPPPDDSVLAPPPPPPGSSPPPSGPQQSGTPPPPGGPGPGAGPTPTSAPVPATTATAKSTDNSSKAGPSLGTVLSMISTNQAKIGNEAKAVVQAAESAAAKDAQQAQTQAESVAALLTEQSIAGSTITTASSTSNSGLPTASGSGQTQTSSVALLTATQTTVGKVEILKQPTLPDLTESAVAMSAPMVVNYSLQTNNSVPATTVLNNSYNNELSRFEPLLLRGPTAVTETEMPQLEGIKIGTRSVLMDAIEQQQPVQQATTQTQQTSAVNRNVQPNELAAGVDISKMATQPAGYQAYSFALADAPFYAPREIYRNQVNVDNVRLLRGLGSDRLHQQLIDLQYK